MQFFEDGFLPTINTTLSFLAVMPKPLNLAGAGRLSITRPLRSSTSWMVRKEPLPKHQKKSLKLAR